MAARPEPPRRGVPVRPVPLPPTSAPAAARIAAPTPPAPLGPDGAATVHLRLLMGPHSSEIALLRAEVRRREHEVERLRSALSEVLARFAELAGRRSAPRSPPTARPGPVLENPSFEDPPPDDPPPNDPPPQDPPPNDRPPNDPPPNDPPPNDPPPNDPPPNDPPLQDPPLQDQQSQDRPRRDPPPDDSSPSDRSPLDPGPVGPPRSGPNPGGPVQTHLRPVPPEVPPTTAVPSPDLHVVPPATAGPSPDLHVVPPTPGGTRPAGGAHAPLVTVVLVTSDWPRALAAAVGSVVDQAYPAWELVVVDDRRPVAPPPLVAAGDGRISVVLGPGRGAGPAFDRGRESAQGHVVAYLADRARMAPGWLAAVACAVSESPEADVFVGRALTLPGTLGPDSAADPESSGRAHGRAETELGWDRSTVAHRRDRTSGDEIGDLLTSGASGSRVRSLGATACVRESPDRTGTVPAPGRPPGSDPGLALVVR